ncbi:immunoglobulin lambda-1 light chain-like [Hyla sarda]|uniref:immunoglobulin lambda-1 light chain-like n=1 Tax=Hyla sarda TaxID=327740 RepID=UPI0024C3D4DC|nr:immunoglobulin lambda-1 light chain-like [Hyla sarda]
MSGTVLLIALISSITYSRAQFTVIQERFMSVSADGTIHFTCTRSDGSVTGDNYPSWYYQTSGSVPKLIVGSYGTGNQNYNPISNRFTGSLSGGKAVLTITKVQPDDDGNYYCSLYGGSGRYIFGPGTTVAVTSGEVKAPSVSIMKASDEELKTDKVTIVCTASDYTPRILSLEWLVDGTKWTTGIDSSPASKQVNNLYTEMSLFTLTTSEFEKHQQYACKVTHQGKEFIQTLKRSECF